MLVLSRKQGQSIRIGDDIVVTLVQVRRNQVRIGVEAPAHVPIYREEIVPTHDETPVLSGSES